MARLAVDQRADDVTQGRERHVDLGGLLEPVAWEGWGGGSVGFRAIILTLKVGGHYVVMK